MSNCLLCSQNLKNQIKFSEIFIFCRKKSGICSDCSTSFEAISEKHCPYCYKNGIIERCTDCQYWLSKGMSVSHTALFKYNKAMANYFSKYKFQGDYILRNVFAKEIKIALGQFPGYTIVPIPISENRKEERGFNQVEGILNAANISYELLLGKQDSKKQSSQNRKERLEMHQQFFLQDGKNIPDKILLIDDIYTTGSTLQSAKHTIMKTGKKEIKTFSLAR